MAYVGILLLTILISFSIVRIGGLALQLTGIEPEVARFQALSAFSGTGFTTTEAERVVRHNTRRRIITILIILGNAGLVAIIGTLVASFTQVTGYGWFFARLAIIVVSIFILYRLIVASRIGNRLLEVLRRPLMRRILRDAPTIEEIFHVGKNWGVSLVVIRETSGKKGLSLSEVESGGDLNVLAVERADDFVATPGGDARLQAGDRLLVYGVAGAIRKLAA